MIDYPQLRGEILILVASGHTPEAEHDTPVHLLDIEDALHWWHDGKVRMAVRKARDEGLITYDMCGYVLTQRGISEFITDTPRQETSNDHC